MVLVIGHRGAPRLARENTVESFAAAIAAGARGIELDVRRTADDALVVHHDPVLDDGRAIVECAGADLPPHVPTLDLALDACRGAIVDVEIKNLPASRASTQPTGSPTQSWNFSELVLSRPPRG